MISEKIYTEFKDKRGIEIFASDILKVDGSCGEENVNVYWSEEENAWCILLCMHEEELLADWIDECEVIGNIHENLELLIEDVIGDDQIAKKIAKFFKR